MKIFNDNKEVIGKVEQKQNSWRSSWLVPKGFCDEGKFLFIGEYNSFNEAQYRLHEFLEKRQKDIKQNEIEYLQKIKKWERSDRIFWSIFISVPVLAVLIILFFMCKN